MCVKSILLMQSFVRRISKNIQSVRGQYFWATTKWRRYFPVTCERRDQFSVGQVSKRASTVLENLSMFSRVRRDSEVRRFDSRELNEFAELVQMPEILGTIGLDWDFAYQLCSRVRSERILRIPFEEACLAPSLPFSHIVVQPLKRNCNSGRWISDWQRPPRVLSRKRNRFHSKQNLQRKALLVKELKQRGDKRVDNIRMSSELRDALGKFEKFFSETHRDHLNWAIERPCLVL